MSLSQPPINAEPIHRLWQQWFSEVWRTLAQAVRQPAYTVATVPDATKYTGGTIYVSDETGGAVLAFSDGTNWRRVTDRAVIS